MKKKKKKKKPSPFIVISRKEFKRFKGVEASLEDANRQILLLEEKCEEMYILNVKILKGRGVIPEDDPAT